MTEQKITVERNCGGDMLVATIRSAVEKFGPHVTVKAVTKVRKGAA